MFLLRLLLKLILLPIMLAVTLLQWVGIFLTNVSGVIFFILSGLVFLIAVLSWVFRIAPGMEVLKMLAIAFVVFIVPQYRGVDCRQSCRLKCGSKGLHKSLNQMVRSREK